MFPDAPYDLFESRKTIICIGDMDTGKTSLVARLLDLFRSRGERPVHVDLDMGQSTIGPPTTIGLKDGRGRTHLCFVGNTSPYGVTGEIRKALDRLGRLLASLDSPRTVIDTPGLVKGGFGLFLARMEMGAFNPDLVVIVDRQGESSHIVTWLQEMAVECLKLPPPAEARIRLPGERRCYRSRLFERYFREARIRRIGLRNRVIIPLTATVERGQVTGLLDTRGFLLCLGLFRGSTENQMALLVPPCSFRKVRSVSIGRYVLG